MPKHERRAAGREGVRIIGGQWRGRRLAVAADAPARPTPDRVRETVFNWLADALPGARCLDLFAGTGVLGLEALSRGAREAWLVERDPGLIRALEARIRDLGARARLIQGDVPEILSAPPQEAFDIVFADPPYELALDAVLKQLPAWVSRCHYVYVERPVRGEGDPLARAAACLPGAAVVKQGRAGRVAFGLMRLQGEK